MAMERQATLQQQQYRFPYHYLPTYDGRGFSQLQHWSWGYRYLGRLEVTFDLLEKMEFESLVDIGCGDGRFLAEVRKRWPDRTVLGIDSSEDAAELARRMSPDVPVETRDILRSPLDGRFDVATLLDVIEHVPPDSLPSFLQSVSRTLRPGGHLVLTVPHRNEPLIGKHYQHFDSNGLRRVLDGAFPEPRFVYFDRCSWPFRLLWKLLGGSGRYYVITHSGLNTFLFDYYRRHHLHASDERACLRIGCVVRKALADDAPGNRHDSMGT
jgi:SAM-dependent methyltransferase